MTAEAIEPETRIKKLTIDILASMKVDTTTLEVRINVGLFMGFLFELLKVFQDMEKRELQMKEKLNAVDGLVAMMEKMVDEHLLPAEADASPTRPRRHGFGKVTKNIALEEKPAVEV